MDGNEGHVCGNYIEQFCRNVFSEEERDGCGILCNDGNVDEDFIKPLYFSLVEVAFENEEEIEKKRTDEVSQPMHQAQDVTGGGERKFKNNDSVDANSNGDFRVNEMGETASVEVRIGKFGIESEQLSSGAGEGEKVALINNNEPKQRTGQQSPRYGGLIENLENGGRNYIEQFCQNVFSEEERDGCGILCNDGNVDEDFFKPLYATLVAVGFKNEEEIEKKSTDEVSQSMHQAQDVTGGGETKFENNDNVEANSNGNFRVNEMGETGSVVVGEFGTESEKLSGGSSEGDKVALINKNEPKQRMGQQSRLHGGLTANLENVRSSGNVEGDLIGGRGVNQYDENVLNQGINGTPPMLHSESGMIMDHSPVLGIPVVQMDSQRGVLGASMPPFYSFLIPFQTIDYNGLPVTAPYVNPTFFMPINGAHVHTMGMLPHPRIGGTPLMLHPETALDFGTQMVQMGNYGGLPGAPIPFFPFFSTTGFPPITPFNPSFFMSRSSTHENNTRMLSGPNLTGRSRDQRCRRMREVSDRDRDRAMSHDQCRHVGTNRGQEKATKEKRVKSKTMNSGIKTRDDEEPNSEHNTPQQKGTGGENDGQERDHNEKDDGRDHETDQDSERPKDLEWEYDGV